MGRWYTAPGLQALIRNRSRHLGLGSGSRPQGVEVKAARTGRPQADIAGDRVRRATGQIARGPQAARQVERFEDLHGLSGRVHGVPLRFLGSQQPQ